MRRVRTHAHLARPIAAALIATLLQGCMRWNTVQVRSDILPATERVRVTLLGGTERMVRRPVVVGDNLVSSERTIPLKLIRLVQVRSVDKLATGVFAFFIVGPIVAYALTNGSGGTH